MHELPPILIAEDNDDDFALFRRSIRIAGVENPVLRFGDGSELLRFIKALPARSKAGEEPWLLFLDLGMPITDGFEVLTWLKAEEMKDRFTTIVLSGDYREENIKRAFGLGASEYLVKPIAPAFLAAIAARSPAAAAAS